jgi:hypothetical protein
LDRLEDRIAPARITWTRAGNDVNWNDPQNWTGGTGVSGPVDDAVINQNRHHRHTVRSVQTALVISNGSLTISALASPLFAGLTLSPGATLRVTGSGTTFVTSGTTTINDGSLYARGGARLTLPNLATYAQRGGADSHLQASGAGSVLDLPESVFFVDIDSS